jgi:translocation and assembly module TamB
MPADAPIHAAARGDGRLETWQRILPLGEDRIAGRFEIDLAVDGTRAAPRAGGRLAIADGRYVNFAAGTELHGIDLELAGDGQRFVLRRLSAGDGARGTMTATGFVDLAAAPGPAFDVATQLAAFRAVRRDDATVTADGELRLSGTPESSRLAGRVRVARAEFRVPERLPPGVASLDVIEIDSRTGAVLSTPPESSPPALVTLDLAVEMPGQVFVRGRGLDSEWRGLLAVRGTNAAPEIAGRLEIVRGDFALLGKSFDLSRGTIAFDGGSEIDPTLDILAVHRKAEITAQAVIAGTASAPTLTLTSAPELPQDEVLARVLFGRGVSQLTPAQGLQLAQAAASLAGGGPGILDRIRGRLGLDRLDVSAGATDPATGTSSGPTVSGGRYIREGVFVGVEQGASTDSTRTKVEVELTPNLTVESDVGANASAGVGVNWRWDY